MPPETPLDITFWTREESEALVGKTLRASGIPSTIIAKICVSQKADQWMVVDSIGHWYKKAGNRLYCWG